MNTKWTFILSMIVILFSTAAISQPQTKTTYCRGAHSERNCIVNTAGCKKSEQCVVQYYYLSDCEVTTCIKKK